MIAAKYEIVVLTQSFICRLYSDVQLMQET